MKIDSIVVLVRIQSSSFLIPKKSIVEINQTGLFNNTIIDIIPFEKLNVDFVKIKKINLFNKSCLSSKFLCNDFYLKGNRGLNYDDLVRATTRISQRFDDPRFFSLFYIFLQNTIDISDDIIYILHNITYSIYFFTKAIKIYLFKYIL